MECEQPKYISQTYHIENEKDEEIMKQMNYIIVT